MRPGVERLLHRVPAAGLALYLIPTLRNVYRYLLGSSRHLDGVGYFGYEVAQAWWNPVVRSAHYFYPLLEMWFYDRLLGPRLTPLGFFIYSLWEIIVLDLILGPLFWYGLLLAGVSLLNRRFRATSPSASNKGVR